MKKNPSYEKLKEHHTTIPDAGRFKSHYAPNERSPAAPDVAVNHRAPGYRCHPEDKNFSQNYPPAGMQVPNQTPPKTNAGYHTPLPQEKSHGYRHQTRDGHLRDSTLGKGHRIGKR